MNHEWGMTFKNAEAKKKMLSTPELTVKGRLIIVVDSSSQDVRVKLHWMLFNVAYDDVKVALAPYKGLSPKWLGKSGVSMVAPASAP